MRTTAPLTGRTQELQALRAVIDADSAGGPRAAVVVAEAGAGKTRLLDEALSQAEALPRHVVRIRGGELTSALPFAVLRRGMRRSIGDDDRIEALLGTRDVEGDSGRAALVDAFADRVERLALKQQVLLVVDDAHWVDEASLTVVDVLARQLASTSLHMVVAARPHPRPAALDSVLRTLRRSGAAITLDLAPLTEHDARRVTESVLGGRGSDRVHDLVERAGGNPLYCTELGLALRDRVVRDADGRLDLPAEDDALGLDVIEHNLAALDVRARTILRDAALLGTTWDPRVLALLRDASVVDVLSSLGAAFEIGVLAEEGDDLVSFRHDLVRDAVLRSTATAVAARRHRDIVLAATTAGLPAEHWAPHLTRADWTGDPQAWEWFERAAEETVSLDAAAALLDHALQTLDGDPPISFVSLQLERLLETDRLPELRQLLEQLLQRPPEAFDEDDDVLDILALRVFHARWWTMGEHREVDIGPWLERLAAQGGEMARDVAALDRLAVEAFSTPTARVTDDAAAIMDRAQARGDERLAITARSIAVICTLHVGTPDEIDAMHVRGIRQQLTSGVYPWILVDDTYFALWCGPRDHPVRDVFDEVARIAERLGPPSSSTLGLIHASDLARKGEWRAAVDLVDHIAEADRGVNLPRPSRATIPIRIYAAVGRADDAAGLLSHPVVLPFSSAPEKARDIGLHHRDAAVAALLAGDDPTDHVDTAFEAWSRTPLATTTRFEPALWASVAVLAGRDDHVPRFVSQVRHTPYLEDWDAAVLDHLSGIPRGDLVDVIGTALDTHDFAVVEALARGATTGTAREVLAEGHQRARDGGATAWARRLQAALARRGGTAVPARSRPDTGVDALTPAEQRVLPLILDGLLYREIADELHNSRRTIESHAASIMRKLGVSSRRELPDVVDVLDLRDVETHTGVR